MTNTKHAAHRPNLAIELHDKETRHAYLHSEKRGLFATLKRMYRPVFKNPRIMAASVFYALSSGVLPLLGVLIMQVLVSLLTKPGVRPQDMFVAAGLYAAAFFVLSSLSGQLLNRHYSWFTRLRMEKLTDALTQLMRMDYGLFENPSFMDDAGNWDRSLSGNTTGYEGIFHKMFEMGSSLISVLSLSVLLGFVSPLIVLLGFCFVLLFYAAQALVTRYQHDRREELTRQERRMGDLAGEAADFRAGKDVRLFHMSGRFDSAFHGMLKAYMTLYRAFTGRELVMSVPESLCLVFLDLTAALILTDRRLRGAIDTAQFVMLLTAVTVFSQSLQVLAQQFAYIKSESLYVGDSFDFIEADLGQEGGSGTVPGEGSIDVLFEDVSFCYPGSDKLVLEHLNLHIKKGEVCALVGVNGAGKTTMVKLLTGLYQPCRGRILINGIDAVTLPQQELFSLFGVVFQETQPLAMTVAENVAASTDSIDRVRVTECLMTAGLYDKVASFHKGMDTPLLKVIEEDGAILSGGEYQKLMIARALYKKGTRMMLLDEPTAALDALAEQKIYQEFESLLSGKTALFISHRLASTRFCDRIIMLDGGRIRQQGSHEELLNQKGLYRDMFITQGKYYQEKREGMA